MGVNGGCDADRDSYDAMVLLTGRNDLKDAGAYANVNRLCARNPAIVAIASPLSDEGELSTVFSRLLVHELGHLMGSLHDGDSPGLDLSGVYNQKPVPCPERQPDVSNCR